MYGLKENVIVGKLIPAGTGIDSFRDKYLGDDVSDLERQAHEEEMHEHAEQIEYNNEKKARSSVVEHCFDVARVSGSIPLAPTSLRLKATYWLGQFL